MTEELHTYLRDIEQLLAAEKAEETSAAWFSVTVLVSASIGLVIEGAKQIGAIDDDESQEVLAASWAMGIYDGCLEHMTQDLTPEAKALMAEMRQQALELARETWHSKSSQTQPAAENVH